MKRMSLSAIKRYFPPAAVLFMAAFVSGCGAGFPIVTAEQEALTANVEALLKDNSALKSRVSQIEAKGDSGIGELKKDVEDIRTSLADTNNSLEGFRQQFSFMSGSAEDTENARRELKDSIQSVNSSLAGVNDRLTALEGLSKETGARSEDLRKSVDESGKNVSGIQESLSALDKRIASLEGRLQAVEAIPPRAGKKDAPADDPEAVYFKGYQETVDKDYAGAIDTFQKFLSAYPDHKLADHAQYWLGENYYSKNDWEKAILEFDKVTKKYPKGDKVAASILKEGFSFDKLGSKKEAKVLFEMVVEKFPNSPEAQLAKKRLEAMK